MSQLIDLVVKIFMALFEKDVDRRVNPRRPGQPGRQPAAKRPAPSPEEFLRELFGVEVQPPHPSKKPEHAKQARHSGTRQQPGGKKKPAPRPAPRRVAPPRRQSNETFDQHTANFLKQADRVDRHADEHIGPDDEAWGRWSARDQFTLPGKTPIQQMIYAQIILGPCKARQSQDNSRL